MAARILVADDEPHIRFAVELKLKTAGYEVFAASSGAAALELAKKQLPNLVVTDYRMPGEMNGIDLIRALRKTTGTSNTPIIMLTGSVAVMQELKSQLADVSNITFLAKPFSPRGLLKDVQAILGESGPDGVQAAT